jgi:cation diffusion facilitator CzcD-associated flavoprotein CzcO
VCFQRSQNIVFTPFAPGALLGRSDDKRDNPPYSEEEIKRFTEDPDFHRDYRRNIVHRINTGFPRFIKGSAASAAITLAAREQMAAKLKNDPEMMKKLIPDWALGCRRITPAEGYLESLQKPNVELVTEGVVRVSENSVFTADGRSWKVDVLACATGFNVSHKPSWNIIGRNGVNLRDEYEIDPVAYLAIAAKDMPNYFVFMGPNAVVTHGSLIEGINWSADYMCKWIKKIATEDIKSFVPRSQVVDELVKYEERVHQTFIWSDSCSSWFKRNTVKGRNIAGFG